MDILTTKNHVNIAKLVENSSPDKSLNFKSRMIDELRREFSSEEQKWFIANLYMYMNYHQTDEFPINLEEAWKIIGFSNKANAKKTLKNNFTLEEDYTVTVIPRDDGKFTTESVMMNMDTYKKLSILVKTPEGKQNRKYYIKLENIYNKVIQQDHLDYQKQLQEAENKLQEAENKLVQLHTDKRLDKQNILLREFGTNCSLVYITKVKDLENGEYIVKIGESRNGVKDRFKSHVKEYGGKDNVLLLDCFLVNNSKKMEYFLHQSLAKHKVTTLPGHEHENELFLIGKELAYVHIVELIDKNILKYNDNYYELEKIKAENKTIELINNGDNERFKEFISVILDSNKKLLDRISTLEISNQKILDKLNSQTTKTTTNFNMQLQTLGPKLQKINPENLQLVKVYETVSEALKESDFKLKRSSLSKAITENTVYHGYRWQFVDRHSTDEESNQVNIHPTKVTKIQKVDYIAKVNADKTKILNVYLNRSIASLSNFNKTLTSFCNIVKAGTSLNNCYYMLYNEVPSTLRDIFEEEHGKPVLYKDGIGKYDSNGVLIAEYVSRMDCYFRDQLSEKSLSKALATNTAYCNFYYRHLHNKVSVI